MAVVLLAGLSASGCATATSPAGAEAPAVVAIESTLAPEGEDRTTGSLWRRLDDEPLEGMAVLWSDAKLFPTAEAARAGAPSRRHQMAKAHPVTVEILADEGDVVKVRTWLSDRFREGMREPLTPFDLTAYAARTQLLPVLREQVSKTYADGTGYALFEGFPLRVETGVAPIVPLPGGVNVHVPHRAVSLSAPLNGEDVLPSIGTVVDCEGNLPDLVPRQWLGPRQDRCTLAKDARVRFQETVLRASDVLSEDGVPMYDVDGQLRFPVRSHRAVAVFAAEKNRIEDLPGRGGGGMGSFGLVGRGGGPPPPTVLAAVDKQKVYYPGGAEAGWHMDDQITKLRGAVEKGGRLCIEHEHLTVRLCFDRDNLKEIAD